MEKDCCHRRLLLLKQMKRNNFDQHWCQVIRLGSIVLPLLVVGCLRILVVLSWFQFERKRHQQLTKSNCFGRQASVVYSTTIDCLHLNPPHKALYYQVVSSLRFLSARHRSDCMLQLQTPPHTAATSLVSMAAAAARGVQQSTSALSLRVVRATIVPSRHSTSSHRYHIAGRRHKGKSKRQSAKKVLPRRFERRLVDSKSTVLTTTLWETQERSVKIH